MMAPNWLDKPLPLHATSAARRSSPGWAGTSGTRSCPRNCPAALSTRSPTGSGSRARWEWCDKDQDQPRSRRRGARLETTAVRDHDLDFPEGHAATSAGRGRTGRTGWRGHGLGSCAGAQASSDTGAGSAWPASPRVLVVTVGHRFASLCQPALVNGAPAIIVPGRPARGRPPHHHRGQHRGDRPDARPSQAPRVRRAGLAAWLLLDGLAGRAKAERGRG